MRGGEQGASRSLVNIYQKIFLLLMIRRRPHEASSLGLIEMGKHYQKKTSRSRVLEESAALSN